MTKPTRTPFAKFDRTKTGAQVNVTDRDAGKNENDEYTFTAQVAVDGSKVLKDAAYLGLIQVIKADLAKGISIEDVKARIEGGQLQAPTSRGRSYDPETVLAAMKSVAANANMNWADMEAKATDLCSTVEGCRKVMSNPAIKAQYQAMKSNADLSDLF